MAIIVKYFGAIEEATGVGEEAIPSGQFSSLEDLKKHVITKYEGVGALSYQLALNQSITNSGQLKDGDEVAFLPPFAGG